MLEYYKPTTAMRIHHTHKEAQNIKQMLELSIEIDLKLKLSLCSIVMNISKIFAIKLFFAQMKAVR